MRNLKELRMKIMFEPLPRESMLKLLMRKILRRQRDNDFVMIVFNGKRYVIPRAVPVFAEPFIPAIAARAPKEAKYGCYIYLDDDTQKNIDKIKEFIA